MPPRNVPLGNTDSLEVVVFTARKPREERLTSPPTAHRNASRRPEGANTSERSNPHWVWQLGGACLVKVLSLTHFLQTAPQTFVY